MRLLFYIRILLYKSVVYPIVGLAFFCAIPLCITKRGAAWGALFAAKIHWIALRIIGISLTIDGHHNLPTKTGFIVAANHESDLDTSALTIGLSMPHFHPQFIQKHTLLYVPAFNVVQWRSGGIFINRKKSVKDLHKAFKKMAKSLPQPLVIFPQGSRYKHPSPDTSYKTGVFLFYKTLGCPVVPAVINSGDFYTKKWYNIRAGRCRLSFLPPIETGLDKQDFMHELVQTVQSKRQQL